MVPLVGAGGLFVRLGHHIGRANVINTFANTTLRPQIDTIAADYASTDQNLINTLYSQFFSYQNTLPAYITGPLQALASSTVIQMVNEDTPLPSATLLNALNVLISQMLSGSYYVTPPTLTIPLTTGGSNIGTPVFVLGLKRPDGLTQLNSFAETINAVTVRDAFTGAAARSEVIQLSFPAAAPITLGWLWPEGSGTPAVSLTCVDAGIYQRGGNSNWLYNGDFETWTVANVPDGWTVDAGTPGTDILQSNTPYDGLYALSFVGGAANTAVHQTFGASSPLLGTSVAMTATNQVTVNLWMKVSPAPAAGVLQVALVDGTNTIINDNQGVPNSFTVTLSSLGSTYVPKNGTFRLPTNMPSAVRLQLKLTTPLSALSTLLMDRCALTQPVPFYFGGPSLAIFSSVVNTILNDNWSIGVTNNRTTTLRCWNAWFDRLFNMRQAGLMLPVTGSNLINDSLIT
jgi:hypothetical protein